MRTLPLVLVALAACAATGNPERSRLAPVTSTPPAASDASEPTSQPASEPKAPAKAPVVTPEPRKPEPAPLAPQPEAAKPQPEPTRPQPPPAATPQDSQSALLLGHVGDRALDSVTFLRKLWVADNRLARRVVEQMVFAELATLEADRLGIKLVEAAVEAELTRAQNELARKLESKGSKLTLREHIDQVIGVEPELYLADLRDETIVQMLAERCVRAYMLETDRCDVVITEVRSAEARDAFESGLALGKGFDELALAHGFGDEETTHVTRMQIARSESQELPRLVFATPQGKVGGPLEQNGRWLFFVAQKRVEGRPGTWAELREDVEKSLVAEPVGDMEFLQWRSAMVRRYRVELEPFFELVERKKR